MRQIIKGAAMDHACYSAKTTELDHLLNDPDVPMDPARVWELLAELATYENLPGPASHEYGYMPA